jgi:hypothetical protein
MVFSSGYRSLLGWIVGFGTIKGIRGSAEDGTPP